LFFVALPIESASQVSSDMVRHFVTLFTLLSLVQYLGALASGHATGLQSRSLLARQVSSDVIPSECTAACAPASRITCSETDVTCLCTQLVADQLSVCVTCIVNAGSPLGPDLVTGMNAYFSECSNNDIILTHTPFPTSHPRTTAAVSTARATNIVTAQATPSSGGSLRPSTSEAKSVQVTMRLWKLVLSEVTIITLIAL